MSHTLALGLWPARMPPTQIVESATTTIEIPVPQSLISQYEVVVPIVKGVNWRNVMIVAVPFSLVVGGYHFFRGGKSIRQSIRRGFLTLGKLSLFSVALHYLSTREPVQIPVSLEQLKELVKTPSLGAGAAAMAACPVAANLASK